LAGARCWEIELTREYKHIVVTPVTGRIGAEISGIDLSKPISPGAAEEMKNALADHEVIFFRDQNLDHESHKAFGRAFGDLAIHGGVPGLPDHPEIVRLYTDDKSKYIAGEDWHSDMSCDEAPPLGSILMLHEVPQIGGDTLFSSMTAAYDALSPSMKVFLDGLTAIHDGEHVFREKNPDKTKVFPRNTHPVVRTHPANGKKLLFVNPVYTTRIVELGLGESEAVLQFLYKHMNNPNFQVRFRWRPHSIAFWDNRATQHMAIWDYFPNVRSGYRVMVAGDRPY
jgi:taurine dioxygenase